MAGAKRLHEDVKGNSEEGRKEKVNQAKEKAKKNSKEKTNKEKTGKEKNSQTKQVAKKSSKGTSSQTKEVTKKTAEKKKNTEQKAKGRTKPERKNDKQDRSFEFIHGEAPFYINECCFGDEYLLYEGDDGHPKYENIDEKWDEFAQWLGMVRDRNQAVEGFADGHADRVGQEVMKWAKRHDAYAVFVLTKANWEVFKNTYLLPEDCPEIVLEFIRGIMYSKMTEKEMWGTPEDRRPKGKLIIFDKDLLPKEGEYQGDIEIEYCPIEAQPQEGESREIDWPIEMYKGKISWFGFE